MGDDEIERWLRESLNERFYEGYPRDYFGTSLLIALAALQSPRGALSVLTEDQYLRGPEGENVLHIKLDADDIDEDSVRETAKLQIANLYYHVLETLLRLFLAHGPEVDRPWLAMVRETDFRKFKDKIAKVAAFDTAWTASHPEDEWFRLAFWPTPAPDASDVQRLTAAKQWMRFAAEEMLDAPAYNAFKHGLALQAGEELIAWYLKEEDPRENQDAKALLSAEGDALILMRLETGQNGSRHWFRETRWLRIKEKVSVIYVAHHYFIPAILSAGASRYLGREAEEHELPTWGPDEALSHMYRNGGLRLTQFSHSLGLAEPNRSRHKRQSKRRRR